MKSFQLVVFLLVVCISSTMALKCNRCIPPPTGGSCFNTVETCLRPGDVCVSVTYSFLQRFSYFKRCMKESDAFILKGTPGYNVYMCKTDRCN